jgi:hypothetical protein
MYNRCDYLFMGLLALLEAVCVWINPLSDAQLCKITIDNY